MSLFRSAAMKYYQLYIPKQDAYQVISKLAPHGFVEFLDAASNNFHKPYYLSIKRCQEVIHKIDQILHIVRRFKIPLPDIPIVEKVFERHSQITAARKITELALLDQMEDQIQKKFVGLDSSMKSLTLSQKQINDLEDYKYLLFKAREIFGSKKEQDVDGVDFSKTTLEQLRLVNVSGVIDSKDILKFSKMIFRATKGNSILYTFNIPNDDINRPEPRTAFIGILESGSNIYTKVTRICDTFYAKKYSIPTNKDEIFEKIKQIEDTINDSKQIVVMTEKKMKEDLQHSISDLDYGYSKFQSFRILIERESMIFHTMNLLEERYNSLIAKIWITQEKRGLLFKLLPSVVTIREPETSEKPPTFFELNQVTSSFQDIVSTYGTPRYQQINPALFAIPIFPFLFGVMFGDIGHGGVVLGFAIWLCMSSKAKQMLPDVYSLRYMLLLMGSFAFYSGWIYNEFFSIPLNIFGSCYGHTQHGEEAEKIEGCVYPFGFDPKWIKASNELNFFNSYKMKFAVIIGVIQMTFAIFLKALNSLHFKNYIDFFFEWIPQQIFFFCTFGYMSILILYKWTIPWGIERDSSQAPSLIAQMIALPLKLGSTEGKPLWDIQAQQSLQYNLLMGSLICVPWMLIFKPLIIWWRMPSSKVERNSFDDGSLHDELHGHNQDKLHKVVEKTQDHSKQHTANHEEHDISQIAVHQIIETIEFILGSISNTASYLRLWALSLAHGQLSRVFLQKTIGGGIESANTIVIALGMYFFVSITLGVIMMMDTMQCFLHALRLLWVQFNSKFFKADGRKFEPLALQGPLQAKALKLREEQQE